MKHLEKKLAEIAPPGTPAYWGVFAGLNLLGLAMVIGLLV